MLPKINVAAYARVSTDMTDQLHSLSAQIKYFTEYISNHENYELIEVYYDDDLTLRNILNFLTHKIIQSILPTNL